MRCQATEKVASVSLSLKTVKNFIYFEDNETATDSAHTDSWRVSSFSEVEKLGKNGPVIIYTSGSIEFPKLWLSEHWVFMITHGNIVATSVSVRIVILKLGSDDVHFAYRPFAHVFELASEVLALVMAQLSQWTDTSNKVEGKAGSAKKLFLIAFNHRLAAMEGSWFGAWGLEKQL
ncbi:hypothetical protein FXO37_24932 [Capsicum annuum]|nr:hypothetical protein FXO37_24932 [Capsicum annuum]